MEDPYFEKNGRFSHVHVGMWCIGPMWPKCAFGDQKGLIWKKATSFGNALIMGQEIADFSTSIIFLFFMLFMGQRGGCFGSKNGVLGCFGPGVR